MLEASSQTPQISRVRSSWKTSEETCSPTADLVCQGLYEGSPGTAPLEHAPGTYQTELEAPAEF